MSSHEFGDHLHSHEDHVLRFELASILRGQFYVSPDVPILPTLLVPGDNIAIAQYDPSIFPSEMYELPAEVLKLFDKTTRSRMAQHGASVLGYVDPDGLKLFDDRFTRPITRYGAYVDPKMYAVRDMLDQNTWNALKAGEQVQVPVLIRNYTQRTLQIGDKDPVRMYREYTEIAANPLIGSHLREAVFEGLIQIDGNENEDWWFLQSTQDPDSIYGVAVTILPQRRWLPPDPSDQIIIVQHDGLNNRESIDTLLKPLPADVDHAYWIGETIPVVFGQQYHALLGGKLTNGEQIKSPLMDGDRDWSRLKGAKSGLRVEILGDVHEEWIPLFFWQDQTA